jgi:hypothetical protein
MSDSNFLPKVTKDEIDPKDSQEEKSERDRDLLENRPPHYED